MICVCQVVQIQQALNNLQQVESLASLNRLQCLPVHLEQPLLVLAKQQLPIRSLQARLQTCLEVQNLPLAAPAHLLLLLVLHQLQHLDQHLLGPAHLHLEQGVQPQPLGQPHLRLGKVRLQHLGAQLLGQQPLHCLGRQHLRLGHHLLLLVQLQVAQLLGVRILHHLEEVVYLGVLKHQLQGVCFPLLHRSLLVLLLPLVKVNLHLGRICSATQLPLVPFLGKQSQRDWHNLRYVVYLLIVLQLVFFEILLGPSITLLVKLEDFLKFSNLLMTCIPVGVSLELVGDVLIFDV